MMFGHAEHGVGQRLPVITRANHFDIAPHFAFIAQQQGNIIAAVAQVKPQGTIAHKRRFSLFAKDDFRQRGGR
ncbi:hypothetical protein D3C81_2015590 [compost metagenome]